MTKRPPSGTLFLLFVPLLALTSMPGVADSIRARQGLRTEDIDAVEQTVFSSPMILEMPFASAAVRASTEEIPVPGHIRRFSCDGVSLLFLNMKGPRGKDPSNRIHFRYLVRVAKGQDKLVSVRLRIISAGRPVLDVVDRAFKVKEEDIGTRELLGTFVGEYPDQGAELQVTVAAKNY